ncbi:MAG: UvrD-helicase domain-containing protein [Longimicrobiales bacterium]
MDQFDLFGSPREPTSVIKEPTAPVAAANELPDEAARRRIRDDLDTSLLVEAGAGAGKTTEMVRRMVSLVRTGRAGVQQIAAVTFTRKAASELRERFQTALERALHEARSAGDSTAEMRFDQGLRDIDRAFLGTIHAFCARLLRERPLEAGLDPGFRETLGSEERRMRREFWLTYLERLSNNGDPILADLTTIGVKPQQLYDLFEEISAQPDVQFPAPARPRPDAHALRHRIEQLMDDAMTYLPSEEPGKGWDTLQNTIRRLRFHRFVLGWQSDPAFLDTMGELTQNSFKATQNRWPNGAAARRLQDEFSALFERGALAERIVREWWEFRYPHVLQFARNAERAYTAERLRAGTLNFQDLLLLAAGLLRDSTAARRELGERYRYLLVDEFQDTDPVQAEVLLLLASEPGRESGADAWWHVTPRPGALFVVGDPKQSIYRFRRADMTLYAQVKARFEQWGGDLGGVVELISNFRSRKPIESFVNDIFSAHFPAEATEVQARYAPMRVQPRGDARTEGVFWYEVGTPHDKVAHLGAEDSQRLATWIAQRLRSGERKPGDFLLLTPNTKRLAEYASALEGRNVPVQVTGAGIVEKMELRELRLLLRALADPGDPTLTVAVLVGLFFGLDYERLLTHVEACTAAGVRDPVSFTSERDGSEQGVIDSDVTAALATLRRYWEWTRELAADVAVAHIVDELGLLPLAAADKLGETRAGALLFSLDAIRAAALAGDASLAGAIAALDAALEEDESEAPLEPGRSDVVRVMNLHKAKGLEAPVVILAHPFGDWSPPPTIRIVRAESGDALGYVLVHEKKSFGAPAVIAQPPEWDRHEEMEARFARAEDQRLLYVAATRAAEELLIGTLEKPASPSPWRSFHPWLFENGMRIDLPEAEQPNRIALERTAEDIRNEISGVDAARGELRRPSYRAAAVTTRKAEIAASQRPASNAPFTATVDDEDLEAEVVAERRVRGTEWGSVVHDALEAAARGAEGEALRHLARGLLIAAERPSDEEGEPLEMEELLGILAAVQNSDVWNRSLSAEDRMIEVPFGIRVDATEYAAMIGASAPAENAPPIEIVDGRMDLVFRDIDGWTIVDYKSDAEGSKIPADLLDRYRGQVRLYAAAWRHLSGEDVSTSVLLFTADGVAVNV